MLQSQWDRVLLIGMMGAGKSTVGHALSAAIDWPYLDNDEQLARAVGKDTRRLQVEDGIPAMRRAESAALTVALDSAGPLIAGVAAGVVLDPLDRQRLRSGGFVVWLHVDPAVLAQRVAGTDRPWLGTDPAAAIKHLYAGRASLYRSVATLTLDEDGTTPELMAREIAARLESTGPTS